MCYNEVSVENEIILGIFAEKGPYNMTVWFVVHLIVTDTYKDKQAQRQRNGSYYTTFADGESNYPTRSQGGFN